MRSSRQPSLGRPLVLICAAAPAPTAQTLHPPSPAPRIMHGVAEAMELNHSQELQRLQLRTQQLETVSRSHW